MYPLPTRLWTNEQHAALVGSVVSMRGVYTALWDHTGLVNPSNCRLGNAVLSVTNPTPADPFATESIRPSDLLLFNSETRAFQRVKVAATVLHKNGTELFVHDGKSGFRIHCRNPEDVSRGDFIEAVGFPRLEAALPMLVLAQTRKAGVGEIPPPVVLKDDFISNPKLDSNMVTIRGTVASDTRQENTRTLELTKKSQTFLARVPLESNFNSSYRKDSLIEITGVYVRPALNAATGPAESFSIEVAEPASISVLRNGPWWTHRHTVILIFTLISLLLLTLVGMTLLRRTVVRRTEEIAVHLREREIIERQRVLDQERSRVAQDLHDELGAGLTEVSMLASLANNPSIDSTSKREYLDQLNGVSCSLVTGLDEIVWAVNPNYDAVGDLAGYLSLFAQQFLQLAGIGCRLNIPTSIPIHRLGTHERHGIFLAFKECLNNVVKHSQASMVHLTIEIRESVLFIGIADNGQGISQDPDSHSGEGLGGMRKRITQLGGIFHIDGGAGNGTTITFEIPLEKS
jgi:signal transduction histidine kinase